MSPSNLEPSDNSPQFEPEDGGLFVLVDEFLEALQRADGINLNDWLQQYPEAKNVVDDLRVAEIIHQACKQVDDDSRADYGVATEDGIESAIISGSTVLEEGSELAEYRIVSLIGRGGMGCVYKAVHIHLNRQRALKVLPVQWVDNRDAVARFHREMEILGRLDHPNIAKATDARVVNGVPFLVMELIDGIDLKEKVTASGPLTVAEACRIVASSADALHYAHEQGVIHRDFKPSNVMLTQDGDIRVLDFGLSLLLENSGRGSDLTAANQIMGTTDFMAPEQGRDAHAVAAQADIYSLGCVLYYLLAGRAPFDDPKYNSPLRKLRAHESEDIPPIVERDDVPPELTTVMLRMLAKQPKDRFATAAEVSRALAPFYSPSVPAEPNVEKKNVDDCLVPKTVFTREVGKETDTYARPRTAIDSSARPRRRISWLWLSIVPLLILAGGIIYYTTNYGTVQIELIDPPPNLQVHLDGEKIKIEGLEQPLHLWAAKHHLRIETKNFKTISREFTVVRGKNPVLRLTFIPKQPDKSPPRKQFTNSIGMKLTLVPAGSFQMGSIHGDDNEKPVHSVKITKPFYIGIYEVTQQQYTAVLGNNPSGFKGDDRPVEMVSWQDAGEFCKKLSAREKMIYRLPTEAEWEYACRAGKPSAWSFGDAAEKLGEYAWTQENANDQTHPVGRKKPNALGLYDMHGNVWEFCSDWYGSYSKKNEVDPHGPAFGKFRVFRGGSYFFRAWESRSANRPDRVFPPRGGNLGFRVVCEVQKENISLGK